MSGFRGHIAFALIILALAFIAGYFLDFIQIEQLTDLTLLYGLIIAGFYAILADLDHDSSMITKIFHIGSFAGIIWMGYVYLTEDYIYALYLAGVLLVLLIIRFLLRHRGLLHTPIGAVIFCIPFFILWVSTNDITWLIWGFFGMVGYSSHLLLDLTH